MMGAETMYGTEPRERFGESLAPDKARDEVMGQSVLWLTKDAGHPCGFPDVDFGIEINEDNCLYVKGGDWEWESGQYRNQALDAEYIRDYAMMAIFTNFSYLKNHSARKEEFRNTVLDWISPIGGKRESYRVVGDLVMTQNDIDSKMPYPDGTAAITWDIDLHYPDPKYRKSPRTVPLLRVSQRYTRAVSDTVQMPVFKGCRQSLPRRADNIRVSLSPSPRYASCARSDSSARLSEWRQPSRNPTARRRARYTQNILTSSLCG